MTTTTPRLAIIIPNHNYADYVGRAIESVRSQGREDCEVVVVDDGSTDASWEVIQATGVGKVLRIANGGALGAVVAGLGLTDAPFVMVLDSDDELKPGSLDRILSSLDDDVAKLQFSLTTVDADGRPMGTESPCVPDYRKRREIADEVVRTGSYTTPPTSGNVFRRDVIDLLADVDYERNVDGMVLFVAPFLGDVVNIRDSLGFYRMHERNVSQAGSKPNAGRFKTEADRFVLRLDHLARVLGSRGIAVPRIVPEDMPFYRERRLYQSVMEGRRPQAGEVAALQIGMARYPIPVKKRIGIMAMAALCGALPVGKAQDLLAYRMQPGERSLGGLARRLVGRARV